MKAQTLSYLRQCLLALALAGNLSAHEPTKDAPADGESLVQIALLLDTSNSMDGLIEQAKTQLWKLVNEFNGAKQGDKVPVVQVALYEYGNARLSAGSNYVRQVLPLTRDLDKVSEELFKLTTNGGDEYCGAVIREALDKLSWDSSPNTYKSIFVAGNEPFSQGPVNPDESCRLSIQKGIVVNTVHCGDETVGVNTGWRKGAALAEGKHLNINQDKAVVHVDAPQDKEISQLSIELNNTYIIYGAKGNDGLANQAAQDKNAAMAPAAGSMVQRAISKASANYSNTGWDLVDATKRAKMKLEDVKSDELPEEMRKLKPEERQAFVDKKHEERLKIQARIQELNEARRKYVADKLKESGNVDTLDTAMASAIREQATTRAKITFR
ncbi:MAG: VWA domain-containing protein [Verrucomicrobiaceae bacterium]|nr:VWA domain-containing protein [Verrucomicrobiaceae bacterium]